jgi:asparagine synthetase B (glutamine-hydrolysing)
MCGIFGYFSNGFAYDRLVLKGHLMAAQASLHHRGPDDRGLESFSIPQGNNLPPFELTFGHTRLSIIDLSSSGDQAMVISPSYTIATSR